jgi:hypothetical protein
MYEPRYLTMFATGMGVLFRAGGFSEGECDVRTFKINK